MLISLCRIPYSFLVSRNLNSKVIHTILNKTVQTVKMRQIVVAQFMSTLNNNNTDMDIQIIKNI